jgi:hypothetical protein
VLLLSRLKRDGNAVGLEVDGVALGRLLAGELRWRRLRAMLTSASPVWQQAATLEPQACWMGMATIVKIR